jgi:cellulose biosynthesis protein BcsQ
MSEDILTALEVLDLHTENDCFLSLSAISGTQDSKVIHLRALVDNQVLSILVDSGSSHTFLNASMLGQLDYLVTPVMRVRVTNGQTVWSNQEVKGFKW